MYTFNTGNYTVTNAATGNMDYCRLHCQVGSRYPSLPLFDLVSQPALFPARGGVGLV